MWLDSRQPLHVLIVFYICMRAKLLQLCPTLCDPVDCCLPGFFAQGILWARILEWIAMPSSRGSSWLISFFGRQVLLPGKTNFIYIYIYSVCVCVCVCVCCQCVGGVGEEKWRNTLSIWMLHKPPPLFFFFFLHVFPIPIPPPTSLSTRSL